MSQRVTLAQALNFAVQHHNAGRLADAEEIYTQILTAVPDNHDALHLLELIANERGDNERAAELIGRAIDIAPEVGEMHGNLALVLQDLRRLEDAAARFEHALSLSPQFAAGFNNLGLVLQELGRLEDTVSHFESALRIDPEFAEALSNLGNALKENGRLEDAAAHHRRAIEIAPDFAEAHNNLGGVLQAQGYLEDAAACFDTALSLNSQYGEAHSNRGSVHQEDGQLLVAIASYRAALSIDPGLAQAHANLGSVLLEFGEYAEALDSLREAIRLSPETDAIWISLAACLERVSFDVADDGIQADLLRLLEHPAVDPSSVTPAILSALRPAFDSSDPTELSQNTLLLRAMTLSPFKDRPIEAAMTSLRRTVLDTAISSPGNESGLPFACSLAQHCFLNEYIFQTTEDDAAQCALLQSEIAAAFALGQSVPATQIAALATYRPLFELQWGEQLRCDSWPEPVCAVIAQQVDEPLEERRYRGQIPRRTPIEDTVSHSVRAQYEENPYPRWTKFAAQHRPEPIGNVLRGAPLRFSLDDYRSPETPEILIAGCGTGQQSLLAASRYANVNILAIDLSRVSLAYAMRKTREHGVDDIEYAQADILSLN